MVVAVVLGEEMARQEFKVQKCRRIGYSIDTNKYIKRCND